MKKYGLILTLLSFSLYYTTKAQAPIISWQKCLGSPYVDWGQRIEATTDGGSIAAGYVGANGGDVTGFFGGSSDYWVVKQDNTGTIQWSLCLGGTYQDYGQVVHQTADGGYIVGGEAASLPGTGNVTTPNSGGLDGWIVKLSSTGSILWQKSFGGAQNEYLADVLATADGGYILAGSTQAGAGQVPGNHGNYDFWVVKVNSDGSMAWQKCIGGSQDDWAYGLKAVADGYVVTGYTNSTDGNSIGNHGNSDLLAVKLDLSGNILWSKCLGGSNLDMGWGVDAATDGSGYLFAGWTRSSDGNVVGNHGSPGDQDAWVVKLDNGGNLLWQHCYGGTFNEAAFSIAATPDGGYVLAGSAESLDGDVSCLPSYIPQMGLQTGWVFKISGTGALLWDKVISGGYYDEEHDAKPTADGGVLVCGYTGLSDVPGYHKDMDASGTIGDFYVGKLLPPTQLTVSINTPPANLCSGAPVTLTASFNGPSSGVVYHWIKNGVDQGINTSSYTATNFANGDQVYCQVVITDADCGAPGTETVTSNTVAFSVTGMAAPAISISSMVTSVCAGTEVDFSSVVTGGSAAGTYAWRVNGVDVNGSGPTYGSTTLANGDIVSCVYTDNTVCVLPGPIVSNGIAVQVQPLVQVSVKIGASAEVVCSGTTVDFTATGVGGGSAGVYEWMVNGNPVGGSATYSTSGLANGDVVSCALTSSAVCASPSPAVSNAIGMTVQPILTSTLSVGYTPATVCSGKPVVFTASAENTGADPSFQWMVNGVAVGGSATYSSSGLADGDVVSCQVSDVAACVVPSTDAVTVTVYPTPVVGAGGTVILNKGQSLTLDLPVTGDVASYAWSPGVGLSDSTVADPVGTPLKTTGYTLTVASPQGCAASGSILVEVFSKLSIPAAFSPNGDGHNDIFYVIGGPIGSKIGDLAVYDRWGQAVFQVHGVAPDDPANGWNGMVDGRLAPTGTYVYALRMVFADGTQEVVKGTVILVR